MKTENNRFAAAYDYHSCDINTARRMISLIYETFFSFKMDNNDRRVEIINTLMSHYEDIGATLWAASNILFEMETDLDAADDTETYAVQIRKKALCEIYGLKDCQVDPLTTR